MNEQGLEHLEDMNSRTTKQFHIHCSEARNNPRTLNTKLKLLRPLEEYYKENQKAPSRTLLMKELELGEWESRKIVLV